MRSQTLNTSRLAWLEQGEWAEERTMAAQFQNIKGNTIDDVRDLSKEVIVYPPKFKTGEVIYPYEKAIAK